tara:strand:- start:907 stop:1059 length:153 start_codon:yes stop_codon:yes gene_type:complete
MQMFQAKKPAQQESWKFLKKRIDRLTSKLSRSSEASPHNASVERPRDRQC